MHSLTQLSSKILPIHTQETAFTLNKFSFLCNYERTKDASLELM